MAGPVGIYISVPFCKAKCTFCNFASGAFAADRMQPYIDRVCDEIDAARARAEKIGASLPTKVANTAGPGTGTHGHELNSVSVGATYAGAGLVTAVGRGQVPPEVMTAKHIDKVKASAWCIGPGLGRVILASRLTGNQGLLTPSPTSPGSK